MRRAVMIAVFAFLSPAEAAVFDLATEYRRDALDFEEEANDFYREKIRIFASESVSAGAAFSYMPSVRKRSWTWNIAAEGTNLPFSFIAGNFYAQEGSGLLYGKLRPYNPDPFETESPLSSQKGFAPCDSSNPAYAFNGGGVTFYGGNRADPSCVVSCAVSRCPRFIEQDAGEPSSTNDSLTSILGRCDRRYPYDTPVTCSTMAGSLSVQPSKWFRCELAALSVTLEREDGGRMVWSRDGGYARRKTDGASLYVCYNDGMVRGYAESAVCVNRLEQGREKARAFQGEFSFTSKVTSISVRGKSIESGYGSPYFSVYGSRLPSDGVYVTMKLSPSSEFSCGAEGSAERKYEGSLGTSESMKERVFFEAEFLPSLSAEISHAAIWEESFSAPERFREKFTCSVGPHDLKAKAGAVIQRSRDSNAYDYFLSGHALIAERHSLHAGAHCILASEENPVYAGLSGAGGRPFTAAKGRLNLYDASYSYKGFMAAGASAAVMMDGKKCVEQRFGFEARCVW